LRVRSELRGGRRAIKEANEAGGSTEPHSERDGELTNDQLTTELVEVRQRQLARVVF
jgi:hypothetical protein